MERTFMGYERPNGDIGIRNHLLIIPTVICSNQVCSRIMQLVPGAVAIPHQHGCSQIGSDKDRTFDMLAGTGKNPNVGAVLIISLGSKSWIPSRLRKRSVRRANRSKCSTSNPSAVR